VFAAQPAGFFTIPHFDGYPAVLVQLREVAKKALREPSLSRSSWTRRRA
jgi:hypothetical protein